MEKELSLIVVKNKWNNKMKKIFNIVMIILFPIVLHLSTELLNGMKLNNIYHIGKKWTNLLLILALFTGTYGITGKIKKSMIITSIPTMTLAIINYLLLEIRGTVITPVDFYSIMLASKLANSTEIKISGIIFISIGIITLWNWLCFKINFKKIEKNKKIILRIISSICGILIFVIFFNTDLLNIEITYNTREFYEDNGICASFLTILKEMRFSQPANYSIEAIEQQLHENNIVENEASIAKKENDENPNIIVIMNESLSDLKETYKLDITEDNMPFIHSLQKNTIKANTHSNAIGSKTANCEWEFLTGNTTRFLPKEAVPYEQYIKKETYSIAKLLKSQGYYTSAYHPYNAQGYNRMLIYPLMGFDEYKFRNDLQNLNEIRYDYVDDISIYKNIINLFENKKSDQKIFNFTVTMQNHLAYYDENFENTIFLEKYDKNQYSEINQYLSSVKLSDEAFKYLVEYFGKFDEPTIIMMYGDHQPGFVENYPEIFGETREDEYDANKYITPMILWANYDIDEYEIDDISMNYLSILLFNEAELEKSKYMEFLEEMYKKYPVINSNVYKDSNGIFHSEYIENNDFQLYEYIQYNNMFDDEKLSYLFE